MTRALSHSRLEQPPQGGDCDAGVRPLPKSPVLGWDSLWPLAGTDAPCVADLPHRAYTSSGRGALHAALRQLSLPVGTRVLVPTYHCPTMVAPVVEAGFEPQFYPLDAVGTPALDQFALDASRPARVMFVAHYFGLSRSLQAVKAWCDRHDVVLVEDCAHSYFGMAGERSVGTWGDYATTSLSKFFPVPEAGMLLSATRPLQPLGLHACGARAQLKAVWDVAHLAHDHRRLAGLTALAGLLVQLRGNRSAPPDASASDDDAEPTAEAIRRACDMGRIRVAPSLAARWLHQLLPTAGIVRRRRDNFQQYARRLIDVPGARALSDCMPEGGAPYVFPLWVEGSRRADAVYARLRSAKMPVFRWDRRWPGTPLDPFETGTCWSRQVLQLLCHQTLGPDDVARVAEVARVTLASLPERGPAS